jgi:lantibiotic modifying enzyme
MFGIAGTIPVLLDFYRRHAQESALSLALKCGDYLIHIARKSYAGFSWNSLYNVNVDSSHDLNGFSHGASGIGWALLELGKFLDEQRFVNAAEEAFRFEQSCFNAERENWPDQRSFIEPAGRYPVAWCHGAAGIGFARLRAYQLTGRQVYKNEAEAALRTTAKMLAFPAKDLHTYSVCHGIAGNSDLFVYASQILGDSTYLETAQHKGLQGIEEIENQNLPWPCGSMDGNETAGLMQGLAGIGYFYLRLHDPARVPPITIILPR